MHINFEVIFNRETTSTREMVVHFLCCRHSCFFFLPAKQNHQHINDDPFLPLTFKLNWAKMCTVFKCRRFKIDSRRWKIACLSILFMIAVAPLDCRHSIRFIMTWCPLFKSLDTSISRSCIEYSVQIWKLHPDGISHDKKPLQWRCDKNPFSHGRVYASFVKNLRKLCGRLVYFVHKIIAG